jgi:hypothetical protein
MIAVSRGGRQRHWPVLALLLFWSSAVAAIDSYRYRETVEGWPGTHVMSGVVVTQGAAYRVELGPTDGPIWSSVVSPDGKEEFSVNREKKTFYRLPDASGGATSSLFRLLPTHEGRPSEVTVQVEEIDADPIAGHPTRKTTVVLAYRLDFEIGRVSFPGHVKATAIFWMTDAISLPLPSRLRPRFGTSFAEVDAKVSAALAGMKGFPLKQELVVTGTVEGEPANTERFEIVIDSFEAAGCDASCFRVPKGFEYHEPVIAKPGVESKVIPQ